LMRGKAGTEINVSIARQGVPDLLDFTIKRDFITLHSVNYSGKIPGTNVGYMRLSTFASNSRSELKSAIEKLKAENVDGIVFDLRSNGGGLLDQSVSISELFLPKNSLIVYTQGRDESSRRSFYSRRNPIYPDKPLVVLVDEGTASASEIVSGALQDHDRAIVMGNTTFGKGLVQQVLNIDGDPDTHLKLTTARYYVPSGRCIQRLDRQWKTKEKNDHESELQSDSLTLEDREVFYTDNGRVVYGGGGIVPDVEANREYWKPITSNMRRKTLFFDFASLYLAENPDVKLEDEITDEIVSEYKEFMKSRDFDYKTALQVSFEEFKETVEEEEQEDLFKNEISAMEKLIEVGKQDDFQEALDDIKMGIKREFVSHIGGEKARYENFFLKVDPAIKQAAEIISSPKEFSRILTEGANRAEVEAKSKSSE
jgi:carboxyl-terminal processing protease